MKTANDNLLRETITGNGTQTVIMDSLLTAETDDHKNPPEDDEDENEDNDDIGLNHDEEDDLSLNIEDDDEEY